jgi:hypothetical protein
VELLVVMSIVVLLATLTLAVVVNMGERDGTTDAAGLTRQWLMIAKNRAARDHANRGLRLVVGLDGNNPAKTSPQWVTELQYIEQPTALSLTNTYPAFTTQSTSAKIVYYYDSNGNRMRGQPFDAFPPECWIENLTPFDLAMVQAAIPGALIVLNDLQNTAGTGPYCGRMTQVLGVSPSPYAAGTSRLRVRLDSTPDVPLGAAGIPSSNPMAPQPREVYMTFNFGITPPPQVIVGEPPLQLPKGICIDLSASQPAPVSDLDILFTPSGHVVPMGAAAGIDGMIILWHRDYTKTQNTASPLTYTLADYQQAGEQQLVSIRCKTGALGQFPVAWPTSGPDPYLFARQGATSP